MATTSVTASHRNVGPVGHRLDKQQVLQLIAGGFLGLDRGTIIVI